MTELEFINADPRGYGGPTNANLLISSSISGSDNQPQLPYDIVGITLPFEDENGTVLADALKETKELRFQFTEGVIKIPIVERQKRDGYFYLRLLPTSINTLPPVDRTVGVGTPAVQDIYLFENSSFIFVPFIQGSFQNSEFNPTINNANDNKLNAVAQVVDRSADAATPTNLDALIGRVAKKAQIQNCNYTKAGIKNGRYDGSKLTSGSIVGDDPALTFREFEASLHPDDSDDTTVKAIQLSDRTLTTVYFPPKIVGTYPNIKEQTFPEVNSYLYEVQRGRFIRVAGKKVYSTDKNNVFLTDEVGQITAVT